jgi:hypothetical protein
MAESLPDGEFTIDPSKGIKRTRTSKGRKRKRTSQAPILKFITQPVPQHITSSGSPCPCSKLHPSDAFHPKSFQPALRYTGDSLPYPYSYRGEDLSSLGCLEDWSSSNCDVCQFWVACVRSWTGRSMIQPRTEYFLFAFSRDIRPLNGMPTWQTVLGIIPEHEKHAALEWCLKTGFILEDTFSAMASMRACSINSLIHPSLFREWLDNCTEGRHGCQTISTNDRVPVAGMQLIDCLNKTIKAAKPNHRYVALSYVWGPHLPKEILSPPSYQR